MNTPTLTIHSFYDVLTPGALSLVPSGIKLITMSNGEVDDCGPHALRS